MKTEKNPLISNGNARMAIHYYERAQSGIDQITAEQGMEALQYWIQRGVERQGIEEAQAAKEANGGQ